MWVQREIEKRGGLASTRELLQSGATSRGLTRAVRSGDITRVRQGWYGLPGAEPHLESAVRVGGRATCLTAARQLGLWVPPSSTLHVRVPPNAVRLRDPSDYRSRLGSARAPVVVHWRGGARGTRHRQSAEDALRDLARCMSPEITVAAATSALRSGQLTRRAWARIVSSQPGRLAALLGDLDERCESILECIFNFRMRRLGFSPEVQVEIAGAGRVDFRLGPVVVELDGWEYHSSRESFEEDRRRDAVLAGLGYVVLRFTYRMITRRWQWVVATVRACLAVSGPVPR